MNDALPRVFVGSPKWNDTQKVLLGALDLFNDDLYSDFRIMRFHDCNKFIVGHDTHGSLPFFISSDSHDILSPPISLKRL